MQIRIEGRDLPGRDCGPGGDFPGYRNIHVAVQRRGRPAELLDLQPGDAPSAEWTLACTPTMIGDGVDLAGPYLQGPAGGRFIYLSWGTVESPGTFTMFRRAKIFLDDVPPATMAAGVRSGRLIARLGLTDAKGNPVCARVRPPRVEWSAA